MTKEQTIATVEQEFDALCGKYNVTDWMLGFVNRRRGKCYYRQNLITVPEWAFQHGHDFVLQYMLHEFAHILTRGHGHDSFFLAKEDELCVRYGMLLIRGRAYVQVIFRHGKKVFDRQETPL